jgi:hypothetical protein
MFYLHEVDGFCNALRLIPIHGFGPAGSYCAKATATGADVAQDHKSGGAFAPAFTHIGAIAAFTNSMEFVGIYEPTDVFIILSGRKFNP